MKKPKRVAGNGDTVRTPAQSRIRGGTAASAQHQPSTEIARHRLTRALLFALPTGCFIVSSPAVDGRPAVTWEILPNTLRPRLWSALRAVGAAQRLCWVPKDRREYEQLLGMLGRVDRGERVPLSNIDTKRTAE